MADYFTELSQGLLDLEDNELVTEAVYPESIAYNKVIRRQVFLPRGTNKPGHGILCFPYTTSVKHTLDMIQHRANFLAGTYYKSYHYTRYYRGRIYTKRFRYNDTQLRKDLYEKVAKEGLRPIKEFPKSTADTGKNCYVELSRYISIFDHCTQNFQPLRYIDLYWNFLTTTINVTYKPEGYTKRFVLCDVNNFPLSKDLKVNLKNPLFCIYYALFRKKPELLKLNGGIEFLFYAGKSVLKINTNDLDKDSLRTIKTEMYKLMRTTTAMSTLVAATDEKEILKEEIKQKEIAEISKPLEKSSVTIIDGKPDGEVSVMTPDLKKEIETKVSATVNATVSKIPDNMEITTDTSVGGDKVAINVDDAEKVIDNKVREEIDNDRELLEKIYRQSLKEHAKRSQAMTARDEKLRKEEENLDVDGVTIKSLEKIDPGTTEIPEEDISKSLNTTNEHMKTIRFNNFEKAYNKTLLKKDIVDAILALNTKSIPMYVLDIKVEDTSDELNYKDTYTIKLEDANRKRHTVVVDIPKFIDDKFLYLGGNKKRIKYQNFFYPIVKIKPDTVLVVSNYNKMTIERVEQRSLSYVERLRTLITRTPEIEKRFVIGNISINNKHYITTLDYDEISKSIISYKHPSDKTMLYFDQIEAEAYREKNKIEKPKDTMFIGVLKGTPVFVDTNTQKIYQNAETKKTELKDAKSILDVILLALGDDLTDAYKKIRPPKRAIYAKVTVMQKAVSVGLLLGLWEGISKVMEKLKVKYRLEDKIPSDLGPNESFMRFNDCVLVYEDNVAVSLIMNGFRLTETAKWSFLNYDGAEPYLQYIVKVYGKAQIENALNNVYEFMIDPITESILKDLHQPTDIVSVMIYAVSLLADSQYVPEINQGLNRIRNNEIIPAILYDALAYSYVKYRNSNGRQKFSVKKDAVISELLSQKTVEDYSVLNPMVELTQTAAISTKGYKGINLDESYTVPKRSYDPSMIGTIAAVTPPDGGCGVTRYLSMEPAVTNLRGYVNIPDTEKKIDKLTDVNVFTSAEMTIPMAGTLDDPNRLGHSMKQSGHVVPVKDACPVLISNGIEERARFMLGSDFVINAEESGEIVDYDEENKIMIAKYKSGKCRAINLAPEMVKNGGGGFWLSNQMTTPFKVGDKFKKGDALAYHKEFFSQTKYRNTSLNIGTLTKIAITSTYDTYEDSTIITKQLSERAATEMCFLKSAVIGKNSNVTYLAQKGDHVEVGDMLAQYDTSFEDESLNALLSVLGDEDRADILAQSKNEIRSKYSGVIEDIKIYSTVELDELSPSLHKIVSKYYRAINKKKEFLDKYDPDNKNSVIKCGLLVNEAAHKTTPNKYGVVKGEHAEDSVLIEFYIKHSEPLEIGSKVANFTALKNTIHEIIPEGYEPWSESHPEEEVSTIIASNSILNRMVPSIFISALGNKCIVELKRKLKEIYDE